MKLPALTYKTRAVWNKALAKLCRIKLDFAQYPPDFLAGLRRNGTCDNALVNGDLLLKVMLRIPCVTLHKTPMGTWAAKHGRTIASCVHEHPVVACAIAADDAGLL